MKHKYRPYHILCHCQHGDDAIIVIEWRGTAIDLADAKDRAELHAISVTGVTPLRVSVQASHVSY